MQITEHEDAINCIDIMEGIALDFKAPLLDLVLANDSTFLSSLPLSSCPKWCFIPFYVPVMLGTSCLHVLLLQMLLSSWRSCIHLPSLPQVQSHSYNSKKGRLYIQNTIEATHPQNSEGIQIRSVVPWTKSIVGYKSEGLMRKNQLIHMVLLRVLLQNSAFSCCPVSKLNTNEKWWI